MSTEPGQPQRGRLAGAVPWSNVYGLARSLLALGTLGTLAASPAHALFRPALGAPPPPYCQQLGRMSLFCVVPREQLDLARWAGVAILLLALSGWRPRWTAVPHWWVAFSLQATATIPDGGDQVTAVLTLLLVPVALTDPRRWHWQAAQPAVRAQRGEVAALLAMAAMLLIRLQVAGIYLHSSVAKLGVREWRDGTAIYYWFVDPLFGTPGWLRGVVAPALRWGVVVAALSWGTLMLEFCLALALVLPKWRWRPLLVAGLLFHAGIGLLMGLWSFALAMAGALVLFLRPWEEPFTVRGRPGHVLQAMSPSAKLGSGVGSAGCGQLGGHGCAVQPDVLP